MFPCWINWKRYSYKTSDVDFCFLLPRYLHDKYNKRKGNLQSQLLQEIKNSIKAKYPNTDINADGQVVDLNFSKRLIELVPCFDLNDGFFTYPDTNNNGSWNSTNPLKQQEYIEEFSKKYPVYRYACQLIRCLKYEQNIHIKGILIDFLVAEFIEDNFITYQNKKYKTVCFLDFCINFLKFLSDYNSSTVFIKGEKSFILFDKSKITKKVNKIIEQLEEKNISDLWDNCKTLFGNGFPKNPSFSKNNTECFIEDFYPIKIKTKLKIDCEIICDGFRNEKLSQLLEKNNTCNKFIIKKSNKLKFFIVNCETIKPYKIYWKIRNVGDFANKNNEIRGEIEEGKEIHYETSKFHGPHFVECYIVKDGICIAKDRIDVPII